MRPKISLRKTTILVTISLIILSPRSFASADSMHSQPQHIRLDEAPSDDIKSMPIPTLSEFIASLEGGDQGQVIGLYIPKMLAVRVVQQPINNPAFVSNMADAVTQFKLADLYGSKGFLVHYNRVGKQFFDLKQGHQIFLIYGNGEYRKFIVHESLRFQALTPDSPYSSFRELGHLKPRYSTVELFNWVYGKRDRLILQTCIEVDSNPNWGRYFIVATPQSDLPKSSIRFQE